ncbi:NusG domain II-containing protein [Candidatus Acetothermia bacterium]|jgi:hypothetical protein|nr:NusG domain II-containing protein [Candidatus Acetothermia bacterium]MCI2431347.1 NusG domain II-containing protein [Candidatus Acetothermia bacterium]MCI2437001.1 NusG domain II-containing protein [Candidatus Acetothermia bacterium]
MSKKLNALRAFWQTMESYLTWGDRLLIFSLLLSIVGTIPLLGGSAEPNGRWAIVRLEGNVIEQIALHKDRQFVVHGPLGETAIEVRQGRVRVERSPGPQQICVRQGWIYKPGEALICLPNRVTIEIPGNSGVDSITR